MIEWSDLWAGIALLLVFEGILPFIYPAKWKSLLKAVSSQSDHSLRIMGFLSMMLGLLIIQVVR